MSAVTDFELFDELPGLPPPGWSVLVAEKLHKNPDKWLLWPYSIVRSRAMSEYILDRVLGELNRGFVETARFRSGKLYLRLHIQAETSEVEAAS